MPVVPGSGALGSAPGHRASLPPGGALDGGRPRLPNVWLPEAPLRVVARSQVLPRLHLRCLAICACTAIESARPDSDARFGADSQSRDTVKSFQRNTVAALRMRLRPSDCQRAEPDRWPPGFLGAERPFRESPTRGRPVSGAERGDGKALASGEAQKGREPSTRAPLRPRKKRALASLRNSAKSTRHDHTRDNAVRTRLEKRARCNIPIQCKAGAWWVPSCREGCITVGWRQACRFCADLASSDLAGRFYTGFPLHVAQGAPKGGIC